MQAQAEGVASVAQGGVPPPGLSAPVPQSKPPFPVGAHIDAYTKLGSDRRLTGVEAFAPLSWDGQILTFADLRFVGDDADGREFNAGLGARRVSDDGSYILGGYGFFDRRRSSTGNLYSQMTLGSEILTEDWDFRLNTYLPLSKERVLSETRMALPASLTLSGTGILASGGHAVSVATERPLAGADIEVGRKLPFLENTWFDDTRAYAGAFHFDAEGVRAMDGFRFRVETAPLSWLRFGAEHQQDNIRGETDFIEARVRIPLDFWRRGKGREATRPEGILKRLDTRISRDVDVVTQGGVQTRDERIDDVPVLNAATGTAQKVYVVDNAAAGGGDGSVEHPFNTLAAAQGAAGAHDIIYVRHGEGTTAGMNAGVTLGQTGQRLIGSGVALDFDAGTMQVSGIPGGIGDGAVIEAAGSAPVLTNAGGDGISITADDVEVAGIQVDASAGDGIVSSNARNVLLDRVSSTGNSGRGLFIEATGASDTSLRMENSVISGNLNEGIELDDESTGSITADLGGGSLGSDGDNNVFGNLGAEISADLDGGTLSAKDNWWGGGALTDVAGPDSGGIDSTSAIASESCSDCTITGFSFTDQTAVQESQLITSNAILMSGFTGSRYVTVSGEGSPELVINGTPSGTDTASVHEGDTVAIRLTSSKNLVESRSTSLAAGQATSGFSATTDNVLANIGNLSLWVDANDLDGDFDYTDNPANGTSLTQWYDKSGNGDVAIKTAGDPDPITYLTTGLGGQAALEFDGQTGNVVQKNNSMIFQTLHSRLILRTGLNSGFTIFQVANWDAFSGGVASGSSGILGQNGIANHFGSHRYAFGGRTGGLRVSINTDTVSGPGNTAPISPNPPLNQDVILTYDIYSNGTNNIGYDQWINGGTPVSNSVLTTNPITVDYPASTNFVIGARAPGNDNYADVTFSEIIVFDKVLSAAERGRVEDYLSAKYSIVLP